MYVSETIVWLVTGLLVLLMGLLGHRIATNAMPHAMRPELSRTMLVTVNLYGVYVAVGGIAFLVSAFSNRRGRAMATVFGIVLMSFLLNFVAQFWEPARQLAFLGVMKYYQPAQILQSGDPPLHDITVLLFVGGLAWLCGGEVIAQHMYGVIILPCQHGWSSLPAALPAYGCEIRPRYSDRRTDGWPR